MRRRISTALVVVALAATAMVASPTTAVADDAPGGIGLSLVDGPVDGGGGLARDRISHVLSAGESAQWTVEVTNTSPQPHVIAVTAGAASLDDGQFRPADDAEDAELPGWVTTDPAEPEVPADGQAEVTVTIDVPDDATDGDHAAIIWASAASDGNVAQVNRIGLRVLITVADGAPAAGFQIGDIDTQTDMDGSEQVVVDVTNTGGRMIEVGGELSLSDGPGGVSAEPIPLTATTIRTGDTAPIAVPIDPELPAGEWTATADVIADRLSDSVSAPVTLGEPPADDPSQAGITSVAVLLLLLAIAALLAAWRRRDKDDEHDDGEHHEAAELV